MVPYANAPLDMNGALPNYTLIVPNFGNVGIAVMVCVPTKRMPEHSRWKHRLQTLTRFRDTHPGKPEANTSNAVNFGRITYTAEEPRVLRTGCRFFS